MGKVKEQSKSKASAKVLTKVKDAGVTKASNSPAAKSKKVAEEIAKKAVKAKKPVEPESSDEEEDSDSSASDSEEEEDSDDSGSDSEEEAKPKANGHAKVNGKAEADDEDDDSSDSSDSSDEEEEKPKAKAATNGVNGKANGKVNGKPAAKAEDSSDDDEEDDDDDDDSDDSEDDDEDDDSDDDEEEADKKEAPSKKRKAEEEEEAETPVKKTRTEDSEQGSTLFVGNLTWNVTDELLFEEFNLVGDLISARVITDKNTGRSRGFGYVDFSTPEACQKAFDEKQGAFLDGRDMRLDFAAKNAGNGNTPNRNNDRNNDRAKKYGDVISPESDTLFVGNLSFDVDEDTVSQFFNEVVKIQSLRLPTDQETGRLKGFGYVSFFSVEDAKAAFEGRNGGDLNGRPVRLDYAKPRDNNNGGGGRGGFGGGFGGGRGGGRGGFGGRGGGRGGFNDRGGRGGGRGGRGGFGGRGGGARPQGQKITF